jgi:hypothetical protein
MCRIGALLTGLVIVVPLSAADPVETLPAPRIIVREMPMEWVPMRVSQYEHWQYRSVDRHGNWRPRVVPDGRGSYMYLYNGQPYPFASTHPHNFAPVTVGETTRAIQPPLTIITVP